MNSKSKKGHFWRCTADTESVTHIEHRTIKSEPLDVEILVEELHLSLLQRVRDLKAIKFDGTPSAKLKMCCQVIQSYLWHRCALPRYKQVPKHRVHQLEQYFKLVVEKMIFGDSNNFELINHDTSEFSESSSKKHERIVALVESTKSATLELILKLITQAKSQQDCVQRMMDEVDRHASDFAARDDYLNGVPVGEINKLKRYLKPVFQKQYERFMEQYISRIQENILNNQAELVSVSHSSDDCVRRLIEVIDGFGEMTELQMLKDQLTPLFENLYADLKVKHIRDLVSLTKEAVLKDRDLIIIQSGSEEDCLARLSMSVDRHALKVIQQNSFLTAMPVGECNKLKRELKPIFKSRYIARNSEMVVELKKQKLDEFIIATRLAMLDRKHEITATVSDLKECMVLLEKETRSFAASYIEQSQFFKSIPEKKLKKLLKQLKSLFKEYYTIGESADGSDHTFSEDPAVTEDDTEITDTNYFDAAEFTDDLTLSSLTRAPSLPTPTLSQLPKPKSPNHPKIPLRKSVSTFDSSTSTFDQRERKKSVIENTVMCMVNFDSITLPSDSRTLTTESEHYTANERRSLIKKAPERIREPGRTFTIKGNFKIPFRGDPGAKKGIEFMVDQRFEAANLEGARSASTELHPDLVRTFLSQCFEFREADEETATFIKSFE